MEEQRRDLIEELSEERKRSAKETPHFLLNGRLVALFHARCHRQLASENERLRAKLEGSSNLVATAPGELRAFRELKQQLADAKAEIKELQRGNRLGDSRQLVKENKALRQLEKDTAARLMAGGRTKRALSLLRASCSVKLVFETATRLVRNWQVLGCPKHRPHGHILGISQHD